MHFHTNLLKRVVIKAGDYALEMQNKIRKENRFNFQGNNYLNEKNAFSKVDYEVQDMIIKEFVDVFSEKVGLIVEEKIDDSILEKFSHFGQLSENKYTIILDPIDGTKNYNEGRKFWGISFSIFYGNEPVYGIIYYPAFNIILEAEKNKGLKINGELVNIINNIEYENHHLIRLSGSLKDKKEKMKKRFPEDNLNYGSLVCTFLSMISENSNNFYGKKGYNSYVGGNSFIWDLGSCSLAWKEAGGVVTDWKGNHINPFSDIDKNMKQKIPFIMAPNIYYANKLILFFALNKDDVLLD